MRGFRRSHVSCRLAYCRDRSLTSSTASASVAVPSATAQKLLEADGLQGRGVTGQAAGQQLPHLVQKALFHHNVHSPVNAVTQLLPIPEA